MMLNCHIVYVEPSNFTLIYAALGDLEPWNLDNCSFFYLEI